MISNNNINFIVERNLENIKLYVNFNNKEFVQFSSQRSDHFSSQDYGNYIINAISTGGCTDVQPINGVYQKKFIKNLFKAKNVKDMSDQLKYLKNHEEDKYIKVFVLDIKDSTCNYNSMTDIQSAEKEVKDFFSGKEPKEKSPRKDIYKIIKENNINYFFCEGKLKHFLVNEIFSNEQSNFFQNTDQGKATLCQISEILLDEFKMGYEILVAANNKTHILLPDDYLILFKNKINVDLIKNPITLSPITLFTLYPAHYKELYSLKEKYCESLSNCFKFDHEYDDKTRTTAIKMRL
jgi:hypothetical protein